MNKFFAFPGIILILFFVFACTMPSEIEIKGSPSLEFNINMDLNDYFSDMIDNALNVDNEVKTIPCTNPTLKTKVFLLHMEIFRKEDYKCEKDEASFGGDNDDKGTITINGVEISVDLIKDEIGGSKKFRLTKEEVIAESEEPYIMTFDGLEDNIEGFEFTGIKSKVYIYGTEIAKVISIEIKQNNTDKPNIIIEPDGENLRESSVVESIKEYTNTALPSGGKDIDISDAINRGGDLSFDYKIYISEGKDIDYDWLDNPQTIVAEIVIWFPMTLESKKENAVFKFSDFFDGLGDVIKSLAGSGYIENMSIKMAMDPLNPFGKGIFIISDDGYGDIKNPLEDLSFLINLNEEEIDYINKNPFDPRFFILYEKKGTKLEIPSGDIMITTISLDAKFNYTMELK